MTEKQTQLFTVVKRTPVMSLQGEASRNYRQADDLRKQAEHLEKQAAGIRREAKEHDDDGAMFEAAARVLAAALKK